MRRRRRWQDLTKGQRAAILLLGSVEWALTAAAATDLWFRPRERVRGRKGLWWPVLLVQPFGPLAYLLAGRREEAKAPCASRN